MEDLSEEQIEEFKEAFSLFDKEGKGHIYTKELGTVLRSLGIHTSDEEKYEFINKYDTDGNGIIKFKQFLEIIIIKIAETKIEEELLECFKLFDEEKKSFLNVNSFRDKMNTYCSGISKEELDSICSFYVSDNKENYEIIKIEEAVDKIIDNVKDQLS